jgi:hypothetical protein
MADIVKTRSLASCISAAYTARRNCSESGNTLWFDRWGSALKNMQKEFPSGSGFDTFAMFDEKTTDTRIVIRGSFHPLDENGYYLPWKEFQVICVPTFTGFSISCTGAGKDLNEIIADEYQDCLSGKYDLS